MSIMESDGLYDLIIIGGGPAGLAAGLYAMRAALKAVLIEKSSFGGQIAIAKGVENYLGFEEISGFELAEKFLQHVKSYGMEVIQDEVIAVEPGAEFHSVRMANSKSIHGYAVILGTGGAPRKLNVPGEKKFMGRGVSYCAKCDGMFFKDQKVVVVGGGDSATEEAIYLAKIATEVHMIDIQSNLRASKILQERLYGICNIHIHSDSAVREIKGNGEGVTSVVISNIQTGVQRELPTDGVFIFIGLYPNSHLSPSGVRRTREGYVITNEKRETSIPGIYAVGDIRHKYANQIVIAVADGCIGALAAAQYIEMKKEEKNVCEFQPNLRTAA